MQQVVFKSVDLHLNILLHSSYDKCMEFLDAEHKKLELEISLEFVFSIRLFRI